MAYEPTKENERAITAELNATLHKYGILNQHDLVTHYEITVIVIPPNTTVHIIVNVPGEGDK